MIEVNENRTPLQAFTDALPAVNACINEKKAVQYRSNGGRWVDARTSPDQTMNFALCEFYNPKLIWRVKPIPRSIWVKSRGNDNPEVSWLSFEGATEYREVLQDED